MNKKMSFLSIIVILILVLTGCQTTQSAQASNSTTGTSQFSGTPPANSNPGHPFGTAATATATPTAIPTQKPTATPTVTAQPVTAAAVSSATAYFTALEKKDFSAAAQWISTSSLSYAQLTRSGAAAALTAQSLAGAAWSDLQIVDSQVFDNNTILVHVTYRTGTAAAATATPQAGAAQSTATAQSNTQKDEIWAFRLEGGNWLYNWNNLIDTRTVDVAAQTANHITIKPTQLVRYSDRIELHFMMQNQTSDVVYFVQDYDSLAVFHFGDQTVEADKTYKVVISGLRTSYDEMIVAKGLYSSYPTYVEIKKWKGYVPNPWYTFQF